MSIINKLKSKFKRGDYSLEGTKEYIKSILDKKNNEIISFAADEDFKTYIADTNDEAELVISKVGFVYSRGSNHFSTEDAKKVAQGEHIDGYADAPVSYIQDAEGYWRFTCVGVEIPMEDIKVLNQKMKNKKSVTYNIEESSEFKDTSYDIKFKYEVLQVDHNPSEDVWGYKANINGNEVSWEF